MQPNTEAPKAAVPKAKTGRPCLVCSNSSLVLVDEALVAGGTPVEVSRRFNIPKQSIERHRKSHVPTPAMAAGARAAVDAGMAHGASLTEMVSGLHSKALALLETAEKSGDIATALRGVREARACIETIAKLTGELDESANISITFAPVMIELQTVILEALAHHPEARRDVVLALGAMSGRDPLLIEHAG